jgi:hypothetical protein
MMVFTVPAVKLAYFQSCMRLLFQQSPSSEEGLQKSRCMTTGHLAVCKYQQTVQFREVPTHLSMLPNASGIMI